jgi:hypothetical protein
MRKAIVMALLVLLLASCTLDIRDEDGFRLFYSAGWSPQSYVVQSHDGYVVDGSIYHEAVFTEPVVVVNVLPRPISVRVWRGNLRRWVTIASMDSLTLDPILLEN